MLSSLPMQPWLIAGLLLCSLAVTLSTSWVVAWLRGASYPAISLGRVLAELFWVLILFGAGLVAARYIERADHPLVYWLVYGAAAVLLSLVRAYLYNRHREQAAMRQEPREPILAPSVAWQLDYLLFALFLYLGLALVAGWYVDPVLVIPLAIGALLPGLDTGCSWLGSLLPFVSHRLELRFGPGRVLHSLGALVLLSVASLPLVLIAGWAGWALLLLGYAAHVILDLLKPDGVMFLWPLTRHRFAVLRGRAVAGSGGLQSRSGFERKLLVALAAVCVLLLTVVDLGQPPPLPEPVPSYAQSLERYYELRGRNQVVASVEGTWQATGRRITDRFEVLNAEGESFVMLDRFTGRVFTAGRGAGDNLYVNRLRLQPGPAIRIQAVEVQLQDEPLADALPSVYQMEREPGLQHIYVSGDLVLRDIAGEAAPSLSPSYAQTSLRHIQPGDGGTTPGHYQLRYLTASELIELAPVEVASADLVIVAAYVPDATGPTPTPLPTSQVLQPEGRP